MIYLIFSVFIALMVMIKDYVSAIILGLFLCFYFGMEIQKSFYEKQKEMYLKIINDQKEISNYYMELTNKNNGR